MHVSRAPHPLWADELAALAKTALYYESALDQLMPPHRRSTTTSSQSSHWCMSNRRSASLASLPLPTCLAAIDAAAAAATTSSACQGSSSLFLPLVAAMNLDHAGSAYARGQGIPSDFVRGKRFKWNLEGMLLDSDGGGGGRGTVEFRQPPGSLAADEAVGWVALALAFVAGALQVGPCLILGAEDDGIGIGGVQPDDAGEAGASLEELEGLLQCGGQALGWEGLGALQAVIDRAR